MFGCVMVAASLLETAVFRIATAVAALTLIAAPAFAQDGGAAAPPITDALDYTSGMMCWAQWTAGSDYLVAGELRDSWLAQAGNARMFAEQAAVREGVDAEQIETDAALGLWLYSEALSADTVEEVTANLNKMGPDLKVCADRLFWSW